MDAFSFLAWPQNPHNLPHTLGTKASEGLYVLASCRLASWSLIFESATRFRKFLFHLQERCISCDSSSQLSLNQSPFSSHFEVFPPGLEESIAVLLGHALDITGILTPQTPIVFLRPHPTHVVRDRIAGDEDF